MDTLLGGTLFDGMVSISAISAKDMVSAARKQHDLSRVCTDVLGRTLMQTAMMSLDFKNPTDRLTCMLKGGGMAGNIVCCAYAPGKVKGYLENPQLELPPLPDGTLDVPIAVGWFGDLTVISDLGMKTPYVGTVQICSGEIAEDFAQYYLQSKQQPAIVYLGVHIMPVSGDVSSAAGLLITPLPGCDSGYIDTLANNAQNFKKLATMLETEDMESCMNALFGEMGLNITRSITPEYACDCSRLRMLNALSAVDRNELRDMAETDNGAELKCHFCNSAYKFTAEELLAIVAAQEANDAN